MRGFEKIKNQNKLRKEDVDTIIETYRSRADLPRYSLKLSDIAANDYNLNIPRYVDTFEAEEQIDIDCIAKSYQTGMEEMMVADVQKEQYCKELGIVNPFNIL